MTSTVCFTNFPFREYKERFSSLPGWQMNQHIMAASGILKVVLKIEDTKELFLNNRTFPRLQN
jgi:hypothetical protein